MAGLNSHVVIPMINFPDAAQIMDLPRGDLFSFSLNPYNGLIVVRYQDNPGARFFARLILSQLADYPDVFHTVDLDDVEFGSYDDSALVVI